MKNEPDIPRAKLLEHINQNYDVQLSTLEFLPLGEGAWCYRGVGDPEVFIRLLRNNRPRTSTALQTHLYEQGFPTIRIMRDKHGGLSCIYVGLDIIIQPFIHAQPLMFLTNIDKTAFHRQVGQAAAQLHQLSTDITLPIENFDRFQAETRKLLAAESNPGYSQIIAPNKALISTLLNTTEALGETLRAQQYDYVVCHGDLHDANVLIDKHDKLFIIDWDTAIRAPRERDLMFFVGESWGEYMSGYGSTKVEQQLMDYYHLEWALQEIADYGSRFLFDEHFDKAGKADALQQFFDLFEQGGDVKRITHLLSL
ncbi:MAG: phosphotransferase [Pseudomonadota bacterium]